MMQQKTIRMSQHDWDYLKKVAKEEGMTASEYIRRLVLEDMYKKGGNY